MPREVIWRKSTRNKKRVDFLYIKINIRRIQLWQENIGILREKKKNKTVKMDLVDKKSQMEVERTVLGKKKCTGTINRWIREYIQEGEENCLKKRIEKNRNNWR